MGNRWRLASQQNEMGENPSAARRTTRQSGRQKRGHGMMNSRNSRYRKQILAAASLIGMVVAQNAAAQEQAAQTGAATEPQSAPRGEEIVVTGSRSAATQITDTLPVTVVGERPEERRVGKECFEKCRSRG